uniref:Uncharacterized protein n=1 Tax=Lactuca sativa TaxID=4236 RepID=A0A9R1WE46_LACSA|nr:hypothetical protein LSAT_V11C200088870 [Lactuca sativa]
MFMITQTLQCDKCTTKMSVTRTNNESSCCLWSFNTIKKKFCKKLEVVVGMNVVLVENLFLSGNTTRLDERWKLYGGDASLLQKFAIRILSQTVSSSGRSELKCLRENPH